MMRTMHGELEHCKKCLHCSGIFANLENRQWTVCDLPRCINEPHTRKGASE